MNTKTKEASVKIMLSYNYCHFEISKTIEGDELTQADIDEARKDCQRLADKSVKQYQLAKSIENRRVQLQSEKRQLEQEVKWIKEKPENTWTVTEKAKVKALADHDWEIQFDYEDDFNDDWR